MKNQNPTNPFTFGKFKIAEPCTVADEFKQDHEGSNKFCSQCQKVIHDLKGKSQEEIMELYKAEGGKLCGRFTISTQQNFQRESVFKSARKPIYLRNLAAAASLLLLYQTPQAKPIASVKSANTWIISGESRMMATETGNDKTNTLITGVILDQDSMLVRDDLEVIIYANQKRIATVQSSHGLFSVDLNGKLAPTTRITMVIRAKKFESGDEWNERSYGSGSISSVLSEAQNIQFVIKANYPMIQVDGGIGLIDE